MQKTNSQNLTPIQKSEQQWQQELTPEQFAIARQHGTEAPFSHPLASNKKPGMYKCVACGLELFTSETKYDSGTGWPSFYAPLNQENVGTSEDHTLMTARTEVHCARCGAHLGHVFNDGPQPTGQRYCMNGTVLDFEEKK